MKRSSKLIIFAVTTALLALAAYLIVHACNKAQAKQAAEEAAASDTEDTEIDAYNIFSIEPTEATLVEWTYNGEDLTFEKDGEDWVYTEDEDFPLLGTYMDSALYSLSLMNPEKAITDVTDFDKYGLEDPAITIHIETEGNEGLAELDVAIGNTTSVDNENYYCSVGDGNVYIITQTLVGCFQYGLLDLVEPDTIPDLSNLLTFNVEGPDKTIKIKYDAKEGAASDDDHHYWDVTDGGETALNNDAVDDYMDRIKNLEWDGCVNYNASDSDLESYGLSDGYTISIDYIYENTTYTGELDEDGNAESTTETGEDTYVLTIGTDGNGNYYGRVGDSRKIFTVSEKVYTAISETTIADLLDA